MQRYWSQALALQHPRTSVTRGPIIRTEICTTAKDFRPHRSARASRVGPYYPDMLDASSGSRLRKKGDWYEHVDGKAIRSERRSRMCDPGACGMADDFSSN